MKLTQKQLDSTLAQLDHIVKLYKAKYSQEPKRDWRTYEQRLALRIRQASQEIGPIAERAYAMIKVSRDARGRHPDITVPQKVLLLLLKDIFRLSNRKMANMLAFFTAFTGIDVSYKTVERCYSEDLVRMTIHNMFILMVKEKGIESSDTCGDGTGYGLTVTKHYRNEREKELKSINTKANKAKKAKGNKHLFAYVFALMDLDTKMYIGYGTSMKSEKEAFLSAMEMARETDIQINSARLDKYYSSQNITKHFARDTIIYVIPKKNATIKGSREWSHIMKSFAWCIFSHLAEYYKRNNSESGFSVDKRTSGWKVWQKREDRIDTALMCKGVWHDLLLIG